MCVQPQNGLREKWRSCLLTPRGWPMDRKSAGGDQCVSFDACKILLGTRTESGGIKQAGDEKSRGGVRRWAAIDPREGRVTTAHAEPSLLPRSPATQQPIDSLHTVVSAVPRQSEQRQKEIMTYQYIKHPSYTPTILISFQSEMKMPIITFKRLLDSCFLSHCLQYFYAAILTALF